MAVERGQAQQGQVVRLRVRFELNNVLFDPVEVRQVVILDSTGATVATLTAADIVNDGVGLRHVDWSIPSAEPTTLHHDVWYATAQAGGTEQQFSLDFFVLSALAAAAGTWLNADDLRAYLPSGSPLTDAELIDLALTCQDAIESICGQKFTPLTEARVFDGQGEQLLNVQRPLQSVTELRILGCPPGTGDQVLDISDLRIGASRTTIAIGSIVPKPFRTATRYSSWDCSYFPMGFQNIQVTGTWGAYTEPPREIKRALGLLVRHAASCDDPLGAHAEAYDQEAVGGDRSYTLRKVWANVTQDANTGFADVDSILARYFAGPSVSVV